MTLQPDIVQARVSCELRFFGIHCAYDQICIRCIEAFGWPMVQADTANAHLEVLQQCAQLGIDVVALVGPAFAEAYASADNMISWASPATAVLTALDSEVSVRILHTPPLFSVQ